MNPRAREEKLRENVRIFVAKFLRTMQMIFMEVLDTTEQSSSHFHLLNLPETTINAGLAGIGGAVGGISGLTFQAIIAGQVMGGPIIATVILFTTYFSGKYLITYMRNRAIQNRRNKANLLKEVAEEFQINKSETIRKLVEFAVNVFSSSELQLTQISVNNCIRTALEEVAVDVANRIIHFMRENNNILEYDLEECFMRGKSSKIFELDFESGNRKETFKNTSLYEKAGIMENGIYYVNDKSRTSKYFYRKKFHYEDLLNYEKDRTPVVVNYLHIIDSTNYQNYVKDMIKKIDPPDSIIKLTVQFFEKLILFFSANFVKDIFLPFKQKINSLRTCNDIISYCIDILIIISMLALSISGSFIFCLIVFDISKLVILLGALIIGFFFISRLVLS